MMPKFPSFKPLELSDKAEFEKLTACCPRNICEFLFQTLFIWDDYLHTKLTLINDNFCVLITPPNDPPFFLEPFGRKKVIGTLNACIEHAGRVSHTSSQYAYALNLGCYNIKPLRDNFDYIYLTENLANLKGRKFDGKRNHLKKFLNKYPSYEFRPVTKSHSKKIIEIFEKWFENKQKTTKPSPSTSMEAGVAELHSLKRITGNFDELETFGGGIFIENDLKGYILAHKLNSKTACGQFMYYLPEIDSIITAIYSESCKTIFRDFKYVNLEDDLGLPGLRKSKLSYNPVKLEEKFDIKFAK